MVTCIQCGLYYGKQMVMMVTCIQCGLYYGKQMVMMVTCIQCGLYYGKQMVMMVTCIQCGLYYGKQMVVMVTCIQCGLYYSGQMQCGYKEHVTYFITLFCLACLSNEICITCLLLTGMRLFIIIELCVNMFHVYTCLQDLSTLDTATNTQLVHACCYNIPCTGS